MTNLAHAQRQTFENRIQRIGRGGANTSGTVVIGALDAPGAKVPKVRRLRRQGGVVARLGTAMADLALVPVAFAVGAIAALAGIVTARRAEWLGVDEIVEASLLAPTLPFMDVVLATFFAMILAALLRLTRGPRRLALMMGVVLAFFLQDAVFATWPGTFAVLLPGATESSFAVRLSAL